MIHTVIFDIGGTLINAPSLFSQLLKPFNDLKNDGLILSKLQTVLLSHYQDIGKGLLEFEKIEDIIKKTLFILSKELNCEDKSKFAKEIYYDTFLANGFLYEDTIEVLEELRQKKIEMIVASDADAELLYLEFNKFNLRQYFSNCFISSELKAYKPSDLFVKALEKEVNKPFDKVLFVGDSGVDIISGKKLGVKTVLKGVGKQIDIEPDYQINNLIELLEIINE